MLKDVRGAVKMEISIQREKAEKSASGSGASMELGWRAACVIWLWF